MTTIPTVSIDNNLLDGAPKSVFFENGKVVTPYVTALHYGPEHPKIRTGRIIGLFTCLLALICLLCTGCVARALCCAHSFGRLLAHSLPNSSCASCCFDPQCTAKSLLLSVVGGGRWGSIGGRGKPLLPILRLYFDFTLLYFLSKSQILGGGKW